MSDDTGMLARVRQTIAQDGQSQGAFARLIGMDESAFSRSLSGQRKFTSLELALIAKRCNVSIDWLVLGDDAGPGRMAARHGDLTEAALVPPQRRARAVADMHDSLRIVGVEPPVPPLPSLPKLRGLDIEQGATLAQVAWDWIEDADVSHLFFEDFPTVIEKAFGINVVVGDFPIAFDGLCYSRGNFRLALLSNARPWTRQRFTLAHECAHILARDSQDLHVETDVMASSLNQGERRANAFAANLLMPEAQINKEVPRVVNEQNFAQLVGRFNVSPSALAYRLRGLRFIDESQRQRLTLMTTRQAAELGGWQEKYARFTTQQATPRPPGILTTAALKEFLAGTVGARVPAALLEVEPEELLDSALTPQGIADGIFDFVP